MSTTKALEIEDRHGTILRAEKEDGREISLEIIGGAVSVEIDETDRRELADWLVLARG